MEGLMSFRARVAVVALWIASFVAIGVVAAVQR
jgi:hypothetical protein